MTARLTLICHGSTDAVRAAAFPMDEPLDHYGETGATELAGRLPNVDFCWTSPELRTRQTAEALGLNASVQPMLRECDYGRWAGRAFGEIVAHEPDAANSWLHDPAAAPHEVARPTPTSEMGQSLPRLLGPVSRQVRDGLKADIPGQF